MVCGWSYQYYFLVFPANALLTVQVLLAAKHGRRLNFSHLISISLASFAIGYGFYRATLYLLDALHKILLYFGSYSEVIIHGVGIIAQRFDPSITLFALATMTTGFLILWAAVRKKVPTVLWRLFVISMIGGAFGFTTMTLIIPIFLIFISVISRNISLRPKRRVHTV